MTIYENALPQLRPGDTTEIIEHGHVFHVTATKHAAFHSGRRLYMVECLNCKETISYATTGPDSIIAGHLRALGIIK